MSVSGSLDPSLAPIATYFVQVLADAGLNPRITSIRRSYASQARLYRRYLAGLSQYPAAPPGTSKHERGLAWDMVTNDDDLAGRTWESWGGRWGGRFRDPIHYEAPWS